jgi:hemerythrin-like metal-binding protein
MDSLNVGITPIDDAHRDMFYLMGDLSEAIHADAVRAAHGMACDFLGKVDAHFAIEEAMMARVGFPGAAVHQAKHQAARLKVAELERVLAEESLALASHILAELETVYFRELLNEDLILARYISGQTP